MKAVLVGSVHGDKLFYVVDAAPDDDDGVLEKQNGDTVNVDFFAFTSKVSGLTKIRTSKLHRMIWDSPRSVTSGKWYETFITKTIDIDKAMLEGIKIHTSLGRNARNIKSKAASIDLFIIKQLRDLQLSNSCCSEMVQSDMGNLSFKTLNDKNKAWTAMRILRTIEEK
jgi:hypothetical protein